MDRDERTDNGDGRRERRRQDHQEHRVRQHAHQHARAIKRALRSDAQRNRERVMEAVWRLLARKGPEDLSMEEVAREADIGKGTLYRHYPNKECLFDALMQEGTERLAASMRDRIPPEADAPTKLRAMVALVYDAYEDYRISIDLLLSARLPHDSGAVDAAAQAQHPVTMLVLRVRGILEQGVREGSFRPLDPDYVAIAVFSLISPMAFAKQRAKLGYTRAQLEERTVDLLLHALGAGPSR